ncbi:two-component response regulator ARR12-like [Abrus precatorius]|uniref:Two-component response regulator ARR12-like n=1 Tax=Abrus precatorius TaxID=3816 RepID=A0A8B8M7X5_ABRPR|nr:two-component response regulator ARR12-like [Abrus precatorius]
MGDETRSLINYVPSFARGFNLLLLHDDKSSLVYLSSLLELYSFKVTATDDSSAAASMICDHKGGFKLVMAKANMPGMDPLSFLDVVLGKDIPVIFIHSGRFDDVTRKALATGLCYFLEEPIRSSDLKYVWQHAYRSKAHSTKETQNAEESQDKVGRAKVLRAKGERNKGAKGGKLKEKRRVDDCTMQDARPKKILSWMNEPFLTVRQVASHLQKHKLRLKRIENARFSELHPVSTSISSNSSHKAPLPSPSEVSSLGTKGLRTPTASSNESHEQNLSLKELETPENSTFPTENRTLDSSMDQNQPATEYNDIIKMLVEDSESFDLIENGTDPGDVDQYCEMLKTVLDGNSSTPKIP